MSLIKNSWNWEQYECCSNIKLHFTCPTKDFILHLVLPFRSLSLGLSLFSLSLCKLSRCNQIFQFLTRWLACSHFGPSSFQFPLLPELNSTVLFVPVSRIQPCNWYSHRALWLLVSVAVLPNSFALSSGHLYRSDHSISCLFVMAVIYNANVINLINFLKQPTRRIYR